jgi:hypothetical protein
MLKQVIFCIIITYSQIPTNGTYQKCSNNGPGWGCITMNTTYSAKDYPFCYQFIKDVPRTCSPPTASQVFNLDFNASQILKLLYAEQGTEDNNECYNAAARFYCAYKFPSCDVLNNELMVCQSTCQNYYSTCGSADLIDFRCIFQNNVFEGSTYLKSNCSGANFAISIKHCSLFVLLGVVFLLL